MTETAAILYVLIVAGVIVFQICLIAGAPWGRLTQGGRHDGSLPVSGRVIAGVSIPLLIFMAAGIASAAGFIANLPTWVFYTALAIQALSTCLNWLTPSQLERRLWAPITTVMLALSGYVVCLN
jgi:hypothetical protein